MLHDLELIKRKYGEDMMHICRDNLGKILEVEGLLPTLLTKHFHAYREFGKELIEQDKQEDFILFMLSKANIKDEEVYLDMGKSAKQLFAEAGYILYPECKTEEDIQAFRHFYRRDDRKIPTYRQGFMPLLDDGEELCTFRGGRLETCRVWFAVKKNVHEIKREFFKQPERQDEYGTSVISIQFTKGEKVRLSIKNRYNHSVTMPDNTFNNNLERIAKGLTVAFEKDFGVRDNIKDCSGFNLELENFVLASDGKYYPYNYEINNVYYCPNNIIIDNFEVKRLPNHQMLVDYLIVDCKNKTIKLYDNKINENFTQCLENKIKSIYAEKNGKIRFVCTDNSEVIMGINKKGQLITFEANSIKECGDSFLRNNKYLTQIYMNALKSCGKDFLRLNPGLEDVGLLSLQKCSDAFMCYSKNTQSIFLPNLVECGNDFMRYNESLEELDLPKLKNCGSSFLYFNNSLKEVRLPKLCQCGDFFVGYNSMIESLFLPSLNQCGERFMFNNISLKKLSLPNLKTCGNEFFLSNNNIKLIDMQQVEVIGKSAFMRLRPEIIKKSNVSYILSQYFLNKQYWSLKGISETTLAAYQAIHKQKTEKQIKLKCTRIQNLDSLITKLK